MSGAAESRWRRPDGFVLIAAAISIFVAALIIYPLGWVIIDIFFRDWRFDTSPFEALAQEHGLGQLILNTIVAISAAATIAMIIGCTFAWLSERTDIGMPFLGKMLPVIPLLIPPIAGAIGWVLLAAPRAGFLNSWLSGLASLLGFGQTGPLLNIFSWPGLIFVYVIYLVPHVYLSVAAGLRNLDPSLEEAARISGARPLAILRDVTLPAVMPAVVSGGVLALITGFALFSVPLIVGGQGGIEVLSVRIVHAMIASYPPKTGVALLLGLAIIVLIGSSWMLQRAVLRGGRFATIGGRGMRSATVKLGGWRWPARIVMTSYLLISSVLPLVALAIVSVQPFWTANISFEHLTFKHYVALFSSNSLAWTGLRNSILLGVIGASLGMLIAAVISFYIARSRGSRLAGLIDGATKLPAAVSHLVIGIAFISTFAGAPFHLHGTLAILLMAYLVLYMPQASLTAGTALAQVGKELVEASLIAGASTGSTFVRVTLPLMMSGLAAGWTMLFVLTAGDITASAMLAGNRNPVSGFVILDLWTNGSFPPLAAFAMILTVLLSTVVMATLGWTWRRR